MMQCANPILSSSHMLILSLRLPVPVQACLERVLNAAQVPVYCTLRTRKRCELSRCAFHAVLHRAALFLQNPCWHVCNPPRISLAVSAPCRQRVCCAHVEPRQSKMTPVGNAAFLLIVAR